MVPIVSLLMITTVAKGDAGVRRRKTAYHVCDDGDGILWTRLMLRAMSGEDLGVCKGFTGVVVVEAVTAFLKFILFDYYIAVS